VIRTHPTEPFAPTTYGWEPAADEALCDALEWSLGQRRRFVRIQRLHRAPSPCRTSAALEQLDLELHDGSRLQLLFKDTSREAMHETARRVKPSFVHDARREIETYRHVLAQQAPGAAECYGALIDSRRRRHWLFLENVPGVELYQVGSLKVWEEAARWLAGFHSRCAAAGVPRRAGELHALRLDAAFYRVWMERARRFFGDGSEDTTPIARGLARLASAHEAIVERLAALPVTFIHGEFYASNVLVQEGAGGVRVCPVDWEMAAVGPGLMDLAALVAGAWTGARRARIVESYWTALESHSRAAWPHREAFLADLVCCRVQIAVQWLGWFGRRRAHADHAYDWLAEAMRLAARVKL
jgi:hypothetical protein